MIINKNSYNPGNNKIGTGVKSFQQIGSKRTIETPVTKREHEISSFGSDGVKISSQPIVEKEVQILPKETPEQIPVSKRPSYNNGLAPLTMGLDDDPGSMLLLPSQSVKTPVYANGFAPLTMGLETGETKTPSQPERTGITADSLARMAGVDLEDPAKAAAARIYENMAKGFSNLSTDSPQYKALQGVMVANLKEETSEGNAIHVAEMSQAIMKNCDIAGLSPEEKAENTIAGLLHDPPNKSPVGGEFLLHNRYSAQRIKDIFTGPGATIKGKTPEEQAAFDRIATKAEKIALTHHESPSKFFSMATAQTILTQELGGHQGQFFQFFGTLSDVTSGGKLPSKDELKKRLLNMKFDEGKVNEFFKPQEDGLSKYDSLASIVDKIGNPFDKSRKEVKTDLGGTVYALEFTPGEQALMNLIPQRADKEQAEAGSKGRKIEAYQRSPRDVNWYVMDKRDSDFQSEYITIAADGTPNYTEPGGFLKMMPVYKNNPAMETGFKSIYEGSYGNFKNHLASGLDMPWAQKIMSNLERQHDSTISAFKDAEEDLKYQGLTWRPERPPAGSSQERAVLGLYNQSVKDPALKVDSLAGVDDDKWNAIQGTYQDGLIKAMYDRGKAIYEGKL